MIKLFISVTLAVCSILFTIMFFSVAKKNEKENRPLETLTAILSIATIAAFVFSLV